MGYTSGESGKSQTIGKLLLQPEVWSWVERFAMSGWGTRQMAFHLINQFPAIKEHYRYEENPERSQEALARLIRYHMQDSLRIDLARYTDDYSAEMYMEGVMARYGFDWRAKESVIVDAEVRCMEISLLHRRRLQARLRHTFYSPFYSKRYDEYRPIRDDGGAEAPPISGFYYRDSEAQEMHLRGKVDTHVGFDKIPTAVR